MAATVYDEPWDRDRRLRELGFTRAQWVEVVKACVAGRGGCTDNDPKSAPGYEAWRAGIRRMREVRSEQWEKADVEGIETIVNHNLRLSATIVNTDRGTADRLRSPLNKNHKGPASERAVDLNCQLELWPHLLHGKPAEGPAGYALWYLCVFDDGNVVRAELSRPIEYSYGYFIKYAERIFILGPGEWDEIDWSPSTEGMDTVIEPDVQRRP